MSLYPVLLVVLVAGLVVADEGRGGGLRERIADMAEPRLAANALRIVQLEQHILKLKKRIEEAEHVDPEGFLHELQARLDDLERSHCDVHEFQCGDDGQECISDLFVCDGHDDCHNHHDEHDDVCSSMPVKAGHVLRGMAHWHDCLMREDHLLTVHIVSTKRFKFFQSRVVLTAIITSTYKDDEGQEVSKEYQFYGGYNYANKRFRLYPEDPEDDSPHFVFTCDFDSGDAEHADCTIETELTQHECASVHLQLEEPEDEDDDD